MATASFRVVRSLTEEQKNQAVLERQREVISSLGPPLSGMLQRVNEASCLNCATTSERLPQLGKLIIATWALATGLPFRQVVSVSLETNRKGIPTNLYVSSDLYPNLAKSIPLLDFNDDRLEELEKTILQTISH